MGKWLCYQLWEALSCNAWFSHLLLGWILKQASWGKMEPFSKKSDLWPAPGSPGLWSCEAVSPALGCHHSFSGWFCCRHWPSHTPSSSEPHRHYGGLPSSGDPAGPPGAVCLLVSLSERTRERALALGSQVLLSEPKHCFPQQTCYRQLHWTELRLTKGEEN